MDKTNNPPIAQTPQTDNEEKKPLAPMWIFKIMNPPMKALLNSRLHGAMSNTLMLLTYQGCKTGKWYTNPIGYFD